ncbi:predicted protein [Nematostella vectensis]|uniref:PH domain-containing protein n=1 Tax=Nematostella vectensis TaxID=45351 RepID=A7SMC2_NEMVE|nr:predicted protein [Nematostella vectensis]|eukprot:XP_001627242.1 predicted protein [Nematostella vectensis]
MARTPPSYTISQTLSGLENFLRDVLANEGLSKEADEQRREFLKKLEVVSSPPTLPPRPAKLAVEKRSPFGNVSSKEAIGSGDESQTSVYSHYRNDNIEDPVAFAQQQRELSRNFTFYSGGYAGRREVFDLPPIAGASVKKHFANRAANLIKSELDKFADWILSYVPEPIKKTVKEAADKRVERLKERIKRLHEEVEDRFTPKEQQTALKGYLKTHGIAGQRGYDPKTFIARIKPKVLELIGRQEKPIKVKFIFTCGFIKEDPATAQIEEELGYFHTEKPEIVTESTDLSDLFDTMTNYLLGLVELFQKQGSGWQFDQLVRYTAESPDEDIPQLFVESLESDIKKIYDKFRFPKKIVVDSFTNKEGNKIDVKRDIRFIDSFRHPEDEKASLSLSLLGHDVTLIDSKESKRAYGFKISKPNSESYFFSTDSRVSVERWIELLSLAATGRQDIIAPYPPYFRSGASGDESKSVKSSESLSLSESYQSADSGEVADELNTSLTCSTSSSHMSAHKMDDDYLSGFAADEQEESDARELDYEGERKKRELRARSPRMRQQRERDRKLKRRKDKKKSSGGSGPESPSTMSPPHSVFVSDPASENKSTAESTATPIDTKDSYPKNQKEKKTWSDALKLKQSKLTRAHTLAGMVLGTPGHESAKSKAGPQSKRSIPSYSHLLPLFDKEGRFSGFLTEVKASKYSVTQLRRWGVVRNGVLRLYNKEGDETPVTMFNLVEMWLTDESDDAKHKYSFSLHTINDKVAKFQVPSKEDFDKWMSVLKVFTEIRVERPIDTSVDESLSHPNVMTRPKSNHSKDDPASVNTFAKRSSIRMKFPPRMNVIDMFKKGNNSYNFENPNTEDIIPANELVCINYSGGQLTEICIGDEENYSCKRSRWCAIKDSELLVFADSSSGDPVKRMVLYNVNVEDLSEPEAGIFQFKVQRGNEVAMFLAHDETSLDKWLKMLRSATEMYGREVTEPEAKCRIPSPKNVFAHRRSQSETLSQTVSLSSATSFTSTSAPEKRKSFISTSASTDSESFTDILMNGHLHEVLQAEKGSSGEKVDEHGTSRWCVVTSERIFMYDSEDSAYARCDWRLADVSVSACIEVPGRRFGFRLRHKDDEVVLGNESREVIEHWLSVMLRYCAPLGQSMSPLTQRVKLECKKSNSDSNLKRTAMEESKIKRTLSEGRASGRRLLRKISEDNILRKYSRSELFRSGSCKGSLEKFNVKLRDKSQLTSAARDIERRFSCGSLFDSEGKYSGYLVEQTSTALCRSQVRRWCVVHDEQMYLFDQPRSETPRKVIPIISAKLVNQSRLEEGVFVFMLEYEGDKCVELRAASRSDLEKWITAISVKIEVLKARVQRRARRSGVIDEEAEITTASARDTIDKQPLEKGSAEASPPTVDSDIPGSSIKPERAASDPTTYITTHKDPIPPEEGGTSDSLNDVSMSSSQQPLDIVEDIKRISLHNESEEEDGGVDGLCVTSVLWDEVTVTSDTPRVIATEPYYANVDRGSMPSEPIYENVSMKSNTLSGLVIRPSELPLPSPTHSHDDSMFVDIVPKQRTKHDLVPLYENVQLKSVLGEGESTDNVFRWKTSEVPTPNNTSPSSEVAKSLEKCSLRDRFSFASDYSGIVGENLLDEVGSVSSDRSRSNTSSSRGSGSDSMRSGNPAFDKELLDDILGFPITQEEAEEISEFCTRCDEEEQFEMSESNFISSVDPDFTSTLGEPGSLSTGDLNGSLDRTAESTPRRSLAESSTSSVHDTYFGVESISDESEEFVDCAQDLRDVSPGKSCDSFKECKEYMPCPSPSCHPKDSTPDEQQCDTYFGRSSESELEKSSETESTQKDLRSDDASIVQVGRVVCSGNRQEENRVSTETLPLPASLEEEGTAETSADMHNKELTSSQVDMLRAVTEAFHGVWEGTHENTKL